MQNMLNDDQWQRLLPALRERFDRLTEQDLSDCGQRLDLLTAKVQNRHWIDRIQAQRLVLRVATNTLGAS
jgi:hypothetical protein